MKRFSTFLCTTLVALMLMPSVRMYAQASLSLSFVDASGTAIRQMEATLGEEFTEPQLVIEPANAGVRVTYSSSNPSIATVDMITGEVTLLAEGNTSIMAQSGQTEQYYSARAAYQLIVSADTPPTPPAPTCPEAYYYYNGARVTTLTMHVGDVINIPVLLGAAGSILPLTAKTVEGIRVAELTEDDRIHAVGVGTATFIGLYQHSVEGQTINCEYSFNILVEDVVPQKQSPELSFDATDVYAELGVPFTPPTFHNPHNVPINKWNSQNPNVAEVSEDGSVVTIKAVGDALIFCESYETAEYYAQSVSYTVHVSTIGLKVKGINVTSLNASDVLGDGSHRVTFDVEERRLNLYSWVIDASDLLGLDAMIKDEGTMIPLTIMLHGVNAITNVPVCIKSEVTPVVIMGASVRDELSLSAGQIAVNTPYFKIHQCAVNATAPLAAIKLGNELGVSKNSHLDATSTGVAIECKTLVLADGDEGVAILTPGIRFENKKGFLDGNNQPAKAVEIGKVPVTVPDDEVTTIDFTATDPEGNETVVFSASTNDTYNTETGQLELATSLSDEVVAQALENLIPGSSAWIDMLPGSLVFDIPAGAGTIQVQCLTLAGYTLQVKMEGQAVVSISQSTLGWADVTYDVPAPIHVVVYLHTASQPSAPARVPTRMEDAISAGACIQAVKIVPANAPAAIENTVMQTQGTQKMMHNGIMYIIRDGKAYNAQGVQVK